MHKRAVASVWNGMMPDAFGNELFALPSVHDQVCRRIRKRYWNGRFPLAALGAACHYRRSIPALSACSQYTCQEPICEILGALFAGVVRYSNHPGSDSLAITPQIILIIVCGIIMRKRAVASVWNGMMPNAFGNEVIGLPSVHDQPILIGPLLCCYRYSSRLQRWVLHAVIADLSQHCRRALSILVREPICQILGALSARAVRNSNHPGPDSPCNYAEIILIIVCVDMEWSYGRCFRERGLCSAIGTRSGMAENL
ncbi:hypothetical protein CEXT_563091 [Caerostris extrusa]|uniref:Uncharacterized protein n=1 Tax=Caerostris extrusa TaxID=172846 RepID=A0AAV4WNE8_CAEEX|nr:hypothetical protein CEXT_563091 [Caerostris extrusa]